MPYIKQDHINTFITALAGTEVSLIADHGEVMIVENMEKVRFAVPAKNITDDLKHVGNVEVCDANESLPTNEPILAIKPTKKTKQTINQNQKSLF